MTMKNIAILAQYAVGINICSIKYLPTIILAALRYTQKHGQKRVVRPKGGATLSVGGLVNRM